MDRLLIEIRNLTKVYSRRGGDTVRAIECIEFTMREGEFVALVGPSGCGKSTLLKILGGLLRQTEGEVLLKGTPVDGPRRDIGFVFQSPVLLPWRNVLDNALLPIQVLGLSKSKYIDRAHELINLVGLEGFEKRYPYELSGGMQQRNAIVRALISDPSLLLMDEPFGALDAMTREHMNLELLRIWDEKKKTVFFITHSIPEAVFLADTVLVMSPRPGRIIGKLKVPIPRPRDRDMMASQECGEIAQGIRRLFAESGASI